MPFYIVKGTDPYGKPVEERIDVRLSRWQRFIYYPKHYAIVLLGHNLAYRLGLTKFRYIDSVEIGF